MNSLPNQNYDNYIEKCDFEVCKKKPKQNGSLKFLPIFLDDLTKQVASFWTSNNWGLSFMGVFFVFVLSFVCVVTTADKDLRQLLFQVGDGVGVSYTGDCLTISVTRPVTGDYVDKPATLLKELAPTCDAGASCAVEHQRK